MTEVHPSSVSATLQPSRRPGTTGGLDLLVVGVLSLGLGVYLAWPQLCDPDLFHDNWRQSAHWRAPAEQHFQPEDLLIRYMHFNNSPSFNWLYPRLARHGEVLLWGKALGLAFWVLTALVVFVTGRALGGRAAGWIAVVIFCLFPCRFRDFGGGFESSLGYLFMCLTVLIISGQRWWSAAGLLAAEAGLYPMAFLQTAVVLVLDALLAERPEWRSRRLWLGKYLPLLVVGLALAGAASVRYSGERRGFGHVATRAEIDHRAEFTRAGRASVIPVVPLGKRLRQYWGNEFHVLLFLGAYLFLGTRVFRLPRGLYALLLSALVLYVLADVLLFRLYFPERYVRRALPVFAALAGGTWLSAVLQETRWAGANGGEGRWQRWVVPAWVGVCLAFGVVRLGREFRPGQQMVRYDRHQLYDAIRSLPGRPMIALHPLRASEIPLLTGKSVLVTSESSHPWWTDYWREIDGRTRDFFRAHYATDPAVIVQFLDKYGIDYFVVYRKYYDPAYVGRYPLYMQPYDGWIRTQLDPWGPSLLSRVPAQYAVYNSKNYQILPAPRLREWLKTQAVETSNPPPGVGSP